MAVSDYKSMQMTLFVIVGMAAISVVVRSHFLHHNSHAVTGHPHTQPVHKVRRVFNADHGAKYIAARLLETERVRAAATAAQPTNSQPAHTPAPLPSPTAPLTPTASPTEPPTASPEPPSPAPTHKPLYPEPLPPPHPPPPSPPPPHPPPSPSPPPFPPGMALSKDEQTRRALKRLVEGQGLQAGDTVVLTFANSAFKELLLNWVANAERANITRQHFVIGAMDADLERDCQKLDLPYYSMSDDGLLHAVRQQQAGAVAQLERLGAEDFRADDAAFRNMGVKKAGFALSLIRLGYRVLICDVDAVFVRDPRPWFAAPLAALADLWVSTDCLSVGADRGIRRIPRQQRVNAFWHPRQGEVAEWWRGAFQPFSREQNGNPFDANFNTGILYFRPGERAEKFLALWIQTIVAKGANIHHGHVWDDQQAFNVLAREGPRHPFWTHPVMFADGGEDRVVQAMNRQVHLGILPLEQFANGHTFFVQRAHEAPGAAAPLMVHNTFQYQGTEGKKMRFRHHSLWHTDPASYWTRGNFLTFDSRVPEWLRAELRGLYVPWGGEDEEGGPFLASHLRLVAHHLEAVRSAFAMAQALNRVLILPPFECHCDRYWYPIVNSCRTPGAELGLPFNCTLDMLFPLSAWKEDQVRFREDSFLLSEHVPDAIKASRQRVQVLPRDEYAQAIEAAAPDQPAGAMIPHYVSDRELKALMAPHKDVRVLEFSSAIDAFCQFEDDFVTESFDRRWIPLLTEQWCCHEHGKLFPDPPHRLAQNKYNAQDKSCRLGQRKNWPVVRHAKKLELKCREEKNCLKQGVLDFTDKMWWEKT